MRHRKKGKILGREKAPREALFRNLATDLIIYEKIKTTKAKAKALRPIAEKIITLAKSDNLHNRRRMAGFLYLPGSVEKLFDVLGPRFKERKGGYTRIIKLPRRRGDAAEMAIIELVEKTTATQIAEIKKDEAKATFDAAKAKSEAAKATKTGKKEKK